MTAFDTLASLEDGLKQSPRFFIEPTDKNPASELQRQATFRRVMAQVAPQVIVYANTNGTHIASHAGRAKANREGRTIGVPDITLVWNRGVAWLEMKAGKGQLKPAQIEFCNRLIERGQHVACYRNPYAAIDWVRSLGAPVRAVAWSG